MFEKEDKIFRVVDLVLLDIKVDIFKMLNSPLRDKDMKKKDADGEPELLDRN